MKSLFSKEALRLLEDNSYRVREKGKQITFVRSAFIRNFIIFICGFVALGGLLFMVASLYIFGLCVFAFGSLALFGTLRKTKGKSRLIIDGDTHHIQFFVGKTKKLDCSFDDVKLMEYRSQLMDEYATASKDTTQEYHHSIVASNGSAENITLINLTGDYADPGPQFMEIYEKLQTWVKGAQTVSSGV